MKAWRSVKRQVVQEQIQISEQVSDPQETVCKRYLFCAHHCNAEAESCALFNSCPPCSQPCEKRCFHSRCPDVCRALCKRCLEPCSWNCEHFSCKLLCFQICERPRCDSPCTKLLGCVHPCIGLCGEPCPSACRICHPDTFDAITRMTLKESESSDRFIELLDCGHIFEVTGLDQWMDMDAHGEPDSAKAIVPKSCPACKMPVWKSFRYGNVVKEKLHQIELVKMKVYGYVKAGMEMLERKQYEQAHGHFKEVIKNQPESFEAHFGFAQALCGMEEFEHAVPHLRFIAESSSLATEVRSLPAKRSDNLLDSSSLNPSFIAAPSQSLAIQSLIQWGSALTSLSEFSDAATLCEIVLRHDKNNASAESLKEMVRKRLTHQVMEAMHTAESNLRGKWYQCPEGHVYAVGDCGRPYAESRCPDCGSTIGGLHDLAAGNKHWH